ncbi:acyltransferase [Pedobacter sp. MC2016-24]|uniref:acyltransferase family protein n=1 Tax=Pedobacter sp. MC2016-24 TaxID=2780090 RepID=UPI0018804A71|nr:acyltransferase [Pedobacter sp. MC2016-24]MBE9599530.1 acyltransferase [Pedobacter sp. MC2016-24]
MIKTNKLDYVDALRGYAILLVIFAHTGQMFPKEYPEVLNSMIAFGPRGVQLFFIVSAFTLFLSCERRFNNDSKPILHFFIRRFFRIAPLYYLGILFYSIYAFYQGTLNISSILSNVFFVNTLSPYWTVNGLVPGGWSISCEMIFYLFVPMLFVKIKSLNDAVLFTIIGLCISIFFQILLSRFNFDVNSVTWQQFIPYIFPRSIPVFGIGICFYYVIFKQDRSIKPIYVMVFALLLIIGTVFNSGFLFIYFQTFAFGVVAMALSKRNFKLVVNRVVKYFGKISYSMYMAHFLIVEGVEYFGFFDRFPLTNQKYLVAYFALKFLLILFVTTGISGLIYRIVEVPSQNLGKKVIAITNKNNKEGIII